MTINEIKLKLKTNEYDFLRKNNHLGKNIILIALGGSYAYGTNNENSDLDIRGCALNSKSDILLGEDFEQVTDIPTDTTIYSFNKLITLLSSCNPNTIEILGLESNQYIYVSDIGQQLIDNRKIFLSKHAALSFGGYAYAQLRRLDNKAARLTKQAIQENHTLNSINNAIDSFNEQYGTNLNENIKLYIDNSLKPQLEKEIFADINFKHFPLRDYNTLLNTITNILREYDKVGKRNQNAIEHGKLSKHMMHLIRLYMMCADILEKEEIITCRTDEHDLLMDIRNGKYLDNNHQPIPAFFELVEEYKSRVDYSLKNTSLPDKPDFKKIREFKSYVNEIIVKSCFH